MKNYTFNFEVQTMVEQFCAAFNDIVVKSFDNKKDLLTSESPKSVRFVYAPKQRVYEKLNTPGPGGITVPVVSVSLGGISRDNTRVFNKNDGFLIPYNVPEIPTDFLKKIPQPVPVNIIVNMTIMTKFQEHMDQILTNFIPYCDPYIIISWKFPGLTLSDIPFEIRSEVLWSGNIQVNYPSDLTPNQPFRLTADTTFTIKGWMFKKMDEIIKKIYYIDSDFIAASNPVRSASLLEQLPLETETIHLSGAPHITSVSPTTMFIPAIDENNQIDVYGKYLLQPRMVYLSGNEDIIPGATWFSPFSTVSNLSAYYPAFKAVPIPNFVFDNDEHLHFEIPFSISNPGHIDVIVENEAGYGTLTTNKYNSAIQLHPEWISFLEPWVRGIKIIS